MSVTITTVVAGTDTYIGTAAATADGDTTATFPHGLGAAPSDVQISEMGAGQALTALSAWKITTIDATNVVCTKQTSTGSGAAGAQLRVTAKRPHTIGR